MEEDLNVAKSRAEQASKLMEFLSMESSVIVGASEEFKLQLRKEGEFITSYTDPTDSLMCTSIYIYKHSRNYFVHRSYASTYSTRDNYYILLKK